MSSTVSIGGGRPSNIRVGSCRTATRPISGVSDSGGSGFERSSADRESRVTVTIRGGASFCTVSTHRITTTVTNPNSNVHTTYTRRCRVTTYTNSRESLITKSVQSVEPCASTNLLTSTFGGYVLFRASSNGMTLAS